MACPQTQRTGDTDNTLLSLAGLGGLLILSIDLITEQGPAISLAYEHAEANVMDRPPRDLNTDKLISGPLLRYAYLIAGVMEVRVLMQVLAALLATLLPASLNRHIWNRGICYTVLWHIKAELHN